MSAEHANRGRPLRVGILGAGMAATAPPGVLPGMRELRDRAVVVAISSRTRALAEHVATNFDIPVVCDTLEQMLGRDDVDAVVNLTPPSAHAETSQIIIEAGRHLVTEKPIAGTVADADGLIAAAQERGTTIVSAPARMLDPARLRARDLIAAGAIGPVGFARVRSSHAGPAWQAWPTNPAWFTGRGVGSLIDIGVYGLQEITGILGSARRVTASSTRVTAERTVRGGPFEGDVVEVEADDNTVVTLEFDHGALAVVDGAFTLRASRSPAVEIFGLDGTVALDDDDPASPLKVYRVGVDGVSGEWTAEGGTALAAQRASWRSRGRAVLVDHLVDCLDGLPAILTAEHARHTLDIVRAAQRSAAEGRRIDLTTEI